MEKQYFTWKMRQRAAENVCEFAIFLAKAKEVLEWAIVKRVGEEEDGMQRVVKKTRVAAIKKFLSTNSQNTIPTSVIVAFGPNESQFTPLQQDNLKQCIPNDITNGIGGQVELGTLTFQYGDGFPFPAVIVDGQHRLNGMSELEEDIPILIVALLDAAPEEQAFQFVVINNKSAKVATDNVKAIIANFNEEQLSQRLAKAGVDYKGVPAYLYDIDTNEESPFRGLLDWPNNQIPANKIIKLTTIESCLRYIKNKIPGLLEEDDEVTTKEIFWAIWRKVKEVYHTLWDKHDEKFLSKVNINALNEYIVDRIENSLLDGNVDIYDPKSVENYVLSIFKSIPEEFWSTKWQIPLQDNGVIRNLIKDDLKKVTHNMRSSRDKSWYQNLGLVSEEDLINENN